MTREEAIAILEVSKHMATSGRMYNQAIDMAIEALSADTSSDIISRADAIEAIASASEEPNYQHEGEDWMDGLCQAEQIIDALPSTEAEWILFKKRPLTDEEKQEYPDWTYIFDCPLPDDEEEILLSNGKYVWTDTFINDGECYLDGGDDIDDGMAWMPLPKPYKGGAE